jgi:hypothetical protein
VLIDFADEARDATYQMTMDPSGNGTRVENPGGRFGGPTQPLRRQPVSPAIMVGRDGVPVLLDADSGLAIDAHNPAQSNGRMQILATGLGKVRPDWPTGLAAPMENPPVVLAEVKVYLDGAPLPVIRATLAPSYIGLYLIEVQLPPITNLGTSELYLSAGGRRVIVCRWCWSRSSRGHSPAEQQLDQRHGDQHERKGAHDGGAGRQVNLQREIEPAGGGGTWNHG